MCWRKYITNKTINGVNSNGQNVVGICFFINEYIGFRRFAKNCGLTLLHINTETHDIIISNITSKYNIWRNTYTQKINWIIL